MLQLSMTAFGLVVLMLHMVHVSSQDSACAAGSCNRDVRSSCLLQVGTSFSQKEAEDATRAIRTVDPADTNARKLEKQKAAVARTLQRFTKLAAKDQRELDAAHKALATCAAKHSSLRRAEALVTSTRAKHRSCREAE